MANEMQHRAIADMTDAEREIECQRADEFAAELRRLTNGREFFDFMLLESSRPCWLGVDWTVVSTRDQNWPA